jgi:hypothetical protein
MAVSTALAYRQYVTVDNSGTGAGQQWLHRLWHLYQYFFTDADTVDSGRWRLVASSAINWASASNVVDNSWFVVEAQSGRQHWQAKFQASNVAGLDESPGTNYCLAVVLSPGGGWGVKGGGNNGFTLTTVPASSNLLLGGTNVTGTNDARMNVHGDRDTVLIASCLSDVNAFTCGGYVGRFEPDTDRITYPVCALSAWEGTGVPKGFDRYTSGGCFAQNPSDSYVLDNDFDTVETAQVWTPEWISSGSHEPSVFSGEYHYRPMELTGPHALLGTLRLVWACGGLATYSRMDSRQKLVLHGGHTNHGVCIKHNGTLAPP